MAKIGKRKLYNMIILLSAWGKVTHVGTFSIQYRNGLKQAW